MLEPHQVFSNQNNWKGFIPITTFSSQFWNTINEEGDFCTKGDEKAQDSDDLAVDRDKDKHYSTTASPPCLVLHAFNHTLLKFSTQFTLKFWSILISLN